MPQYDSQFEENLYNLRREKLAQIAALVRAQDPSIPELAAKFPNTFRFTHTLPALRHIGDPLSTEELAAMPIQAAIAGRLMAIRLQGKAGFAQLQQDGQRLQLYIRRDDLGASPEQSQALFDIYKLLDLGDHIGVRGTLMRTRTGELTLHAGPITLPGHEGQPAITFLAKAMLALPDKFSGLEDIETRYRRRYVDLIMNSGNAPKSATPEPTTPGAPGPDLRTRVEPPPAPAEPSEPETPTNVREVFVKRAAILRSIRHFFDSRGFLEVETPMLHTIAGGAAARTFDTHHNAEDMRLILRIAPELHLKRLVVGGLDRVYEINRNFRNEGIDRTHNPEFTMLEFYQAYANYNDLMDLTIELIQYVANEVNGTTITHFNGTEIDLSKWTKLSMREAISEFWNERAGRRPSTAELTDALSLGNWIAEAIPSDFSTTLKLGEIDDLTARPFFVLYLRLASIGMQLSEGEMVHGKAIAEIFELIAEPHLIQPTIIYDFPLAVSPLSKVKPDEPDWVERFEFYIGGFEVGNAFSELNDADDQLRRFQAQLADRERGDEEAMAEVDEDYVRALGYGLPPTAGEGIGIDRLTMLLTGSRTIRDVILFPLMRPQNPGQAPAEDER